MLSGIKISQKLSITIFTCSFVTCSHKNGTCTTIVILFMLVALLKCFVCLVTGLLNTFPLFTFPVKFLRPQNVMICHASLKVSLGNHQSMNQTPHHYHPFSMNHKYKCIRTISKLLFGILYSGQHSMSIAKPWLLYKIVTRARVKNIISTMYF